MKIALIVPGARSTTDPRGLKKYERLFPHLLPMSIGYMGAVLEREGYEVLLVDQIAQQLSNEDMVDLVARARPDVVGVSVLTAAASNVAALGPLLRTALPEAFVVHGNHHASFFAEETLDAGFADAVIHGEGEETLLELVRVLAGDAPDLSTIRGLSFLRDGVSVHNPTRPLIEDLDSLPYPAWHHFDLKAPAFAEMPMIGAYSTPLPLQASRGCPHGCSFCSQDASFKKVRMRRVDKLVDEIEFMVDRYGFEWFGFNDAYFPWTKRQGFEFADELIRRGLHRRTRWVTENRVDQVDEELLVRLRESGLSTIFFGFESGNAEVLARTGKGTTLAQAEAAARAARNAGVTIVGFFMIGLPGDTVKTCLETVDFAIRLDCDFAKFAVAIPYPGSQLFESLRGQLGPRDFDKFLSWYNWASGGEDILSMSDDISPADLLRIQRLGMLRFYARPRQVIRHLRRGTLPLDKMAYGAGLLLEGATREVGALIKRKLGWRP